MEGDPHSCTVEQGEADAYGKAEQGPEEGQIPTSCTEMSLHCVFQSHQKLCHMPVPNDHKHIKQTLRKTELSSQGLLKVVEPCLWTKTPFP